MTNSNVLLKSDAKIDPAFMELKERVATSQNPSAIHLRYEDVYNIDRASFADHPELLSDIARAQTFLEQKPYGQDVLRDILLNEHRTERVAITTNLNIFVPSPAAYVPAYDAMFYNTKFPKEYNELTAKLGFDKQEVISMHEGDHAANMYGDTPPQVFDSEGQVIPSVLPAYTKWQACHEEKGRQRENLYRADVGLPLRENYLLIDEELGNMKKLVASAAFSEKDRKEIHDMQINGMPLDQFNEMREGIKSKIELGNGCAEGLPEEELNAKASEYAMKFLNEMGMKIALPPIYTGEQEHPSHGLNPILLDLTLKPAIKR